jgi:hypothetical protein
VGNAMTIELSNLKKYLNDIGLPSVCSVNADKTKGKEIKGFDQLTISWTDNDISKSVQVFPEILDMNIKRWNLTVSAWIDNEKQRLFWTETLVVKKSKDDMIAVAIQEIKKAVERLKVISLKDLESTTH